MLKYLFKEAMVPIPHPLSHQNYGNLAVYITYFNINTSSSNITHKLKFLYHLDIGGG